MITAQKLAVVGLAHPYEIGYEDAPRLMNETIKALEKAGVDCLATNVVMEDLQTVMNAVDALRGKDYCAILICVATWSEDHHLFDLMAHVDRPVILRAYPAFDTGSLCCVHQIASVLTELDKFYSYVYGEPDDASAIKEVVRLTSVFGLVRTMRSLRVGAIGGRVQGMTEIAYDEFGLMDKIGSRVINICESELLEAVCSIDDDASEKVLSSLDLSKHNCVVLSSREDLSESVKYYMALKQLCEKYGLGALAVKCYTKYMGKVCLGYSLLAEDGIACSCEGDVPNALTTKMLYELSGLPVNNTDLLYPDTQSNTILFAHCGSSAMSIAGSRIELAPVRLAETGVCTRFIPKTGEVTLVNLCGHGEKMRLSVMTGNAIPCGMEFPGNPAKVQIERPVLDLCKDIATYGIGHHWMVGYGNLTEQLEYFCKLKNLNFIKL